MKRGADRSYATSLLVLGVLVAAGFAAVGFGWRGVAASAFVPDQVPYAVSGVFGGLALAGFAMAMIAIQAGRRAEANRRADLERVVDAAIDLLDAVRREAR